MTEDTALVALRMFLEAQPPGPIKDVNKLLGVLANAWSKLSESRDTSMRWDKLRRIENPVWEPPHLGFEIERHGQTVMGSTRATVYHWQIDIQSFTATVGEQKRRQIYATDKRLDVKPIAQSLAEAIVHGRPDDRLKVMKDGRIKLDMERIIPATFKETTAKRRARLRSALNPLLAAHGWIPAGVNAYTKTEEADRSSPC